MDFFWWCICLYSLFTEIKTIENFLRCFHRWRTLNVRNWYLNKIWLQMKDELQNCLYEIIDITLFSNITRICSSFFVINCWYLWYLIIKSIISSSNKTFCVIHSKFSFDSSIFIIGLSFVLWTFNKSVGRIVFPSEIKKISFLIHWWQTTNRFFLFVNRFSLLHYRLEWDFLRTNNE